MTEKDRRGMTAVDEPPREDPESQPQKGRGKQKELPGVVDNVSALPDVTRAVKKLKELRSEWQALGTSVAKQGEKLIALMHEHGIRSYIAAGLRVELAEGKERVKIRELGDEDNGEE